jgi:hypothetical protein
MAYIGNSKVATNTCTVETACALLPVFLCRKLVTYGTKLWKTWGEVIMPFWGAYYVAETTNV